MGSKEMRRQHYTGAVNCAHNRAYLVFQRAVAEFTSIEYTYMEASSSLWSVALRGRNPSHQSNPAWYGRL